VTVTWPLSENATFYVQLAIGGDASTNVAYSYPSGTGTVQAGTNRTIYVPPSSNVTLRATPSLFVYSFASWQGAGFAKRADPSVSLVVDSPTAVTGASSLYLPVIFGIAAAALLVLLATALLVRKRRRREGGWA
jgi:LPXTG-motif cell wall-anchored protein